MLKENTAGEFQTSRGQLRLWAGLLLPPIAWSLQLMTIYLTTSYGCQTAFLTPNHAVSIAALGLSIIGGALAAGCWIETGTAWNSEGPGPLHRSRFMAILGVLGGGLFTLLIFAQWLPTLMGVPC